MGSFLNRAGALGQFGQQGQQQQLRPMDIFQRGGPNGTIFGQGQQVANSQSVTSRSPRSQAQYDRQQQQGGGSIFDRGFGMARPLSFGFGPGSNTMNMLQQLFAPLADNNADLGRNLFNRPQPVSPAQGGFNQSNGGFGAGLIQKPQQPFRSQVGFPQRPPRRF